MVRSKIILGLAVAILMVAMGNANAAWPTKEFRITKLNPDTDDWNKKQGTDDFGAALPKAIAAYESYLGQVAARYERMGFKAPNLPIIAGRSGGNAFQVFMYDFPATEKKSARVGYYFGRPNTFRLDLSRHVEPDGGAVLEGFDNLAHELFHAVQRAYQPRADADLSDWIMEGQAQAVGMEFARLLLDVDIHKGKQDDYRLGGRPYFERLNAPQPPDDRPNEVGYRTASFWRYLAEHYAATKRNARAGVTEGKADYSYLKVVFDVPFVVNGAQLSELEWLDQGLRQVFGLSLARLHANFLATHGGYVPARLTKAPSGTPAEARTAWLERNFGPCPVSTLTATQPGFETEISLAENAARCIRARVFDSGKADLTINVRSESMQALEALRIGTVGGEKVGTPLRIESPVGGGYLGVWEFAVDGGERESFVITNMADDPTLTLPFRGIVSVMTNFWESNLTDAGPSAERRRDTRPAPGGDATRQRAKEELDADLAGLSNRSTAGASVTFERNRPKCSEPFGATGCGPLTGINLSLTPGVLGNFYKTSGTGGPTSQVMTALTAIADRGALGTDQDLKAALEKMEATEGGWLKITLPAIDYGFTGEISNASITVNGGAGQGDLEARGPEDSQPGRGFNFWRSGRVTIDEFTPLMLRGSFSAQLVDMRSVDFDALGDDPTLPVKRSISGRFAITSPWRGDPNIDIHQLAGEEGTDQALMDLSEAFPALKNYDFEGVNPGPNRSSGTAIGIGFPVSAVTEFPACSCSCSLAGLSSECKATCKPAVLACGQNNQRLNALRQGQAAEPVAPAESGSKPVDQLTREEFMLRLRDDGWTETQIEREMPEMDLLMEERGGWPD